MIWELRWYCLAILWLVISNFLSLVKWKLRIHGRSTVDKNLKYQIGCITAPLTSAWSHNCSININFSFSCSFLPCTASRTEQLRIGYESVTFKFFFFFFCFLSIIWVSVFSIAIILAFSVSLTMLECFPSFLSTIFREHSGRKCFNGA